MKSKKNWLKNKWAQLALALCIAILFYLCFSHLNIIASGLETLVDFFSPVIIGLVLAYLMDPIVQWFDTKVLKNINGFKRHVISVTLTIIIVIVVVVLLIATLVPPIIESIINLVTNFDSYAAELQKFINQLHISNVTIATDDIINAVKSLLPSSTSLKQIMETGIQFGIGFVNFLISFILAIYFLVDEKNLQHGLGRLLRAIMGKEKYASGRHFWIRCNRILIKFIATDLLDGFIIGVSNFIFMSIMRMPFVALMSVVVGVTNLAPTFGPFVGGFIGAVLLVLVNPWYALWFIIFTICLQLTDGYILKPKLFGNAFDVPSVWILIFIVVGGRMFGVIGILLAIPAAAIMTFVYRESILPGLEKRRMLKEQDKLKDHVS